MTRKFSLIAASAGAALLVAVPAAWGKGQSVEPQWQQALEVRSEALNRTHGLGEYSQSIKALKLRSEALNRQYGLGNHATSAIGAPDAFSRAVAARLALESTPIVSPDAVDRVKALQLSTQSRPSMPPDAFERAVAGRISTDDHFLANDNRFRIDPSKNPAPVSVTSSGRELDWPQIGMGFGLGIVLALGLFLAMRYTRIRPLAH